MSATISMLGEDAVFLFTDGAVYDRQLVMRELKRKVAYSPIVPIAVATRGDEIWSEQVSDLIVRQAEEMGVDAVLAAFARTASTWKLQDDYSNLLEVTIAFWSEKTGPGHRVFTNLHREDQPNAPADVLFDPGKFWLGCAGCGGNPNSALRPQGAHEDVTAYAADCGIRLMQFYRQQLIPASDWDADREPRFCVGGHVDMTIVNRNGVRVDCIHTWPDKIGEVIDVTSGQPSDKVTPITVGMNRQQRRAMKHAARRDRAV